MSIGRRRPLSRFRALCRVQDGAARNRAVDPDGLFAQQVVGVTVNGVFVSFTMRVIDTFGDAENGEPRSLRGFTFTQDADDDPNAFNALLQ